MCHGVATWMHGCASTERSVIKAPVEFARRLGHLLSPTLTHHLGMGHGADGCGSWQEGADHRRRAGGFVRGQVPDGRGPQARGAGARQRAGRQGVRVAGAEPPLCSQPFARAGFCGSRRGCCARRAQNTLLAHCSPPRRTRTVTGSRRGCTFSSAPTRT